MLTRTFAEHVVRPVESLCGLWDFVTADDRRDERKRKKLPGRYTRSILVPSVWETIPDLVNYRGKGWLRTHIAGADGAAARLVFGGVSHTGTVYVDGKRIGGHYDAFTPWDVLATGLDDGEHELVVEVDNSFGPHSTLHIPNDYYTYGGITRPAELQFVGEVFIERLRATPRRKRNGTWDLAVAVRLRNWSRNTLRRKAVVVLDDHAIALPDARIKPGATREFTGVIEGIEAEPWTAATPRLYDLAAVLFDGDVIVDDKYDRIGFRDIQVRGKKLLLNGESIRLRGYNRHEDHGQFGCALPLETHVADLQILRDLGCNFVRTSHYPNDQRFLDLCDEMGFYVWEESHARQTPFDPPDFLDQISRSTAEMLDRHHNHPSIILWGLLNECESDTQRGRRVYKHLIDMIRTADGSRPVTAASHKRQKDVCYDLVDIVSWNLYSAWYGGRPDNIEAELKPLLKWLHAPGNASGGRGKPVILSEFGAGAIPGYHNMQSSKWTEDYQAEALETLLDVYLNHPDLVGAAIWQFCDCRVTEESHAIRRPRTHNNKGTVDEYRKPKLAYRTVKARMHKAAKTWGV
ncbi:MAG: glycoside hydrolase family 2 protein [Planctomycetota bacterium]